MTAVSARDVILLGIQTQRPRLHWFSEYLQKVLAQFRIQPFFGALAVRIVPLLVAITITHSKFPFRLSGSLLPAHFAYASAAYQFMETTG